MPITDSDNSIKPTAIPTCKRTYIVATGRATADANTADAAVRQAKQGAKNELATADAAVRALVCPQDCRDGVCRDHGLTKQGAGLDWSDPVKNAATKLWRCRAWAYHSYYKHCRCEG